jgi:hypothetical protein
VANRADLSAEEDPSFALILGDLDKAGVVLRAASAP